LTSVVLDDEKNPLEMYCFSYARPVYSEPMEPTVDERLIETTAGCVPVATGIGVGEAPPGLPLCVGFGVEGVLPPPPPPPPPLQAASAAAALSQIKRPRGT
jgi:hypothetical protein